MEPPRGEGIENDTGHVGANWPCKGWRPCKGRRPPRLLRVGRGRRLCIAKDDDGGIRCAGSIMTLLQGYRRYCENSNLGIRGGMWPEQGRADATMRCNNPLEPISWRRGRGLTVEMRRGGSLGKRWGDDEVAKLTVLEAASAFKPVPARLPLRPICWWGKGAAMGIRARPALVA